MIINIPSGANEIIEKLQVAGFEAFAVGGCVRDSLLGKTPLDWDITTPALPSEITQIFGECKQIQIGSRHGTVAVKSHGQYYEITTYRIDGTYGDGRRPDQVSFTSDLREDLRRRDFTINAIAYSPKNGLVDYFGGIDDLRASLIRCVGNATERFAEDYLRIIRAYRFAAVLGFSLEENTQAAAVVGRCNLDKIARERIGAELSKLLVAQNFNGIKVFLNDCADVILPDFAKLRGVEQSNAYHLYDVYEHTLEVLRNTPPVLHQRLAAIFHDTGKPQTKTTDDKGIDHFYSHAKFSAELATKALRHLCFDNIIKNDTVNIIRLHDNIVRPDKTGIKRFINKHGAQTLRELLIFQRADNLAKSDKAADRLYTIAKTSTLFEEIISSHEPVSIKDLALSGKDIIRLTGLNEGKEIGEILTKLLAAVIENPSLNNKNDLAELI
ncbi:MAG: HD domain-containing protein [Defluviitaleaceae bacterium]|nr:HD domain-containing protein [Defluviitaleaceae bacterium]